jgi:hypothetical protein
MNGIHLSEIDVVGAYKQASIDLLGHYNRTEAELRLVVEEERRRLRDLQRFARLSAIFCFVMGAINLGYMVWRWYAGCP